MTATAFTHLALGPAMQANLAELGYTTMTPIQAASLPSVLAGRDVIAQAKTGSGKTAAFGIGLLAALEPSRFAVQALVLCPTRELAEQVAQELRRLARALGNVKILNLSGGVAMGPQLDSLEHGAHIVVGTPGRVLKHLDKGSLELKGLRTLVLDEADRMLDMGFFDSMMEVLRFIPQRRQTLLFSATYSPEIRRISEAFQREPVTVTVEAQHDDAVIEQHFFEIDKAQRAEAACALLQHYQPATAVLFCNTKQRCDEIAEALRNQGFYAQALHGDLEQRDRDQVLVQFANQSQPLLVATDVAARGLDIKDLAAVINVDIAFEPEVHVHRIGRTGRAGQSGLALSLCAPSDAVRANAIAEYQQQELRWSELPAFDHLQRAEAPRMVTLNIAGGRKDKLRPGDILGALTGDAGIAGDKVGKIAIFDMQAYVAVDRDVAKEALARLGQGKIKGRSFRVRRLR